MRMAGIDIGSRTVKLAVFEDSQLVFAQVRYNSHDPISVSRELLSEVAYDRIAATGYGRHLFRRQFDCEVLTEIRAVSLGAKYLDPRSQAVIDIGGQDTKAIVLDAAGRITRFEMNDKCAAGTGRFLEIMAAALSFTMDEFVAAAATATGERQLSSMCTVFAESEAISLLAQGVPRDELSLGIHGAIARRTAAMLRRLPIADPVMFCGGGAKNASLRRMLEQQLNREILVAPDPQIVAAIGCALHLLTEKN